MPRLPVLIRQNQVFELVLAGRTHAQIAAQLQISDDTIARDMEAIGEQVQEIARSRLGELTAVALANYQAVYDEAWEQYHADRRRVSDWYAGRLDYQHESVATKTLAAGDDDASSAVAFDAESAPLEVKTTRRTVRPALQADRVAWLRLAMDATREFCELMGIKKLQIEHQGKGGGPVEYVHMSLDEWKQQAAQRVAAAEQTLAQFGDDAAAGDA